MVVLVRNIGKAAFNKSAAANPGGVKPVTLPALQVRMPSAWADGTWPAST